MGPSRTLYLYYTARGRAVPSRRLTKAGPNLTVLSHWHGNRPQTQKRSKHKEALVLPRKQQNCEAPKKSQKQAGGKAPERRRPLWTPSDGNAANGLFLIDFAAMFPCAHSAKSSRLLDALLRCYIKFWGVRHGLFDSRTGRRVSRFFLAPDTKKHLPFCKAGVW